MKGPAPQAPLVPLRTGSTTDASVTGLAVLEGLAVDGLIVLVGLSGTHHGLVVPGREVVDSGTHHGLVVLGGDAVLVTGGAMPTPPGYDPDCEPKGKKAGHQGEPIGNPGFDGKPINGGYCFSGQQTP